MIWLAVKQYRKRTLWQSYTATVLGMIGKLLGGESWTIKSYVEMAYPDQIQTDTRSAEEIKQDIIKRLTGNDSI